MTDPLAAKVTKVLDEHGVRFSTPGVRSAAGEYFAAMARTHIAAEIRDQAERFRLASTNTETARHYFDGMDDAAAIAEGNTDAD